MTHTLIEDRDQIRKIIVETFNGDDKLFEQFHFINGDECHALADTFLKIEEVIEMHRSLFLRLHEGDKTIGYINVAPKISTLHSFGLHKDYRSEENKKEMMGIVEQYLSGDVMVCTLYTKNKRAINFLKSMGYEEQHCVTLIKNR